MCNVRIVIFIFLVGYLQVLCHAKNAGLQNSGSDCFMNSALQFISHMTPIIKFYNTVLKPKIEAFNVEKNRGSVIKRLSLKDGNWTEQPIYDDAEALEVFGEFMNNLVNPKKGVLKGNNVADSPKVFRRYWTSNHAFGMEHLSSGQKDSQEFMEFLLDKINDMIIQFIYLSDPQFKESEKFEEKRKKIIEDKKLDYGPDDFNIVQYILFETPQKNPILFAYFKQQDTIKCLQDASHQSIVTDFATYLFLSIKGNSLLDSFQDYSKKENFEDKNKLYCSQCKKHVDATKWFEIASLPRYLIIMLKRFKFDQYGRPTGKDESPVIIPESLTQNDLPCVQALKNVPVKYNIISFTVHNGTVTSGHYWAYGKDKKENWYEYNDSSVQEAKNKIAPILASGKDGTGTIYFLLYKKELSPIEQMQENLEDLSYGLLGLKFNLQMLQEKLGILRQRLQP